MPKADRTRKVMHIDCFNENDEPITVLKLKEMLTTLRDTDYIELDVYYEDVIKVYRKETEDEYQQRIQFEKQQREEKKRQERLERYLKLKKEFEQGESK